MGTTEKKEAPAVAGSAARAVGQQDLETAHSLAQNVHLAQAPKPPASNGKPHASDPAFEAFEALGRLWRAAQSREPLPDGAREADYGAWAEHAGCIIEGYDRAGPDGARDASEALGKNDPKLAEALKERRTVTLADLADILPATTWLWPSWLPVGYLSMAVGASGVGKSWLALRLAESVLTGKDWPDGTPCERTGPVVWCDTEASQALLLERATGWKLPTHKILLPTIDGDPVSDVLLDDDVGWGELLRLVEQNTPPLVIVDSLSGAHRGDENSAELRDLMSRLARLARDRQIAVMATHHLRKANPFEELSEVTLDRIRGTTAIPQYARLIMALDRPDALYEPDRVRLKVIKSNLARFPEPLGFEIGSDTGLAFGKAPEAPREASQVDKAEELLRSLLEYEPILADEVFANGRGMGISEATLRRAKKKLSLVSIKKGKEWYWSLPARSGDDGLLQ